MEENNGASTVVAPPGPWRVGFTGTRSGMTAAQVRSFDEWIRSAYICEFHHGDCVGADNEAAHMVALIDLLLEQVVHPPVITDLQAHNPCGSQTRPPKTYFARNRAIVDETDILVATPATPFETSGGTWYTINYAIKQGKPVRIILPDGRISPCKPRVSAPND